MTLFETQIAELQTSYEHSRAAIELENAEIALLNYQDALRGPCSPSTLREATARYRQSVDQMRASGVRHWSSQRLNAEIKRACHD